MNVSTGRMVSDVTKTYICACEHEATAPANAGLPKDWELREVEQANGGNQTMLLCADCARFEAFLIAETSIPDAEQRTHDSSSAINDDLVETMAAPPIAPKLTRTLPVGPRDREWQIVAVFHTEKGIVETSTTVGARNPLAAVDELEVQWSRLSEMFALTITPAPLEVN